MGCGLNKLEKRDDRRSGNIYSTLKRPQVETKIDVSYAYRFLEFTTLSAGEPGRSAQCGLGGPGGPGGQAGGPGDRLRGQAMKSRFNSLWRNVDPS